MGRACVSYCGEEYFAPKSSSVSAGNAHRQRGQTVRPLQPLKRLQLNPVVAVRFLAPDPCRNRCHRQGANGWPQHSPHSTEPSDDSRVYGKDPRHIHLTECTQRGSLDPRFTSRRLLPLLHFNRNGHRTREQFVAPDLAVHRHGWVYRPEPIVCLVLEGHKSIERGRGRERKPTVTVGVEYECANRRIRAPNARAR